MSEARVFRWDHQQQPPMDEIAEAVVELSGDRVHMAMPDTNSDEYELVVYAGEPS